MIIVEERENGVCVRIVVSWSTKYSIQRASCISASSSSIFNSKYVGHCRTNIYIPNGDAQVEQLDAVEPTCSVVRP